MPVLLSLADHYEDGVMRSKWILLPLVVLFLSTACLEVRAGQPLLQAMHEDFPSLAGAIANHALGDV